MTNFHYKNEEMYCENIKLSKIAEEHGTPCFVYSKKELIHNFRNYRDNFSMIENTLICYAVKSNSNLSILKVLVQNGAGLDIVSIGELERGILAGCPANKIVFSGVGKQDFEIRRALELGIKCFNIESIEEFRVIDLVAKSMNKKAPIAFRINPNVDAGTHPYTSTGLKDNKFGIAHEQAIEVYEEALQSQNVDIIGIDFHIGSQINDILPFIDSLKKILEIVKQLKGLGIQLEHIDIGGGIGVQYDKENTIDMKEYASQVNDLIQDEKLKLILEPGRSISASSGVLLGRVLYEKSNTEKKFVITDTAMNDVIRPSLYHAYQEVKVAQRVNGQKAKLQNCDIVGPICESGDFIAKDRPFDGQKGDLIAIMMSGAYCSTMNSNYNSRNRSPEILVSGENAFLIKKREVFEDQIKHERTDYFLQ